MSTKSKAKSKTKQEEALQLLDEFDSFTPVEAPSQSASDGATGSSTAANTSSSLDAGTRPARTKGIGSGGDGETAEALAFLEEITQKSTLEPSRPSLNISRSGTPVPVRKSTERVRLGASLSAGASSTSLHRQLSSSGESGGARLQASNAASGGASASSDSRDAGSGWGWGSVWNTASAALQQAKSAVDEQVKHLPQVQIPQIQQIQQLAREGQARKWSEGVLEYAKNAQLDKLGQDFKRVGLSTLNDILNVVAPPISEHEVIQVWLSHDMQGYDGVESLTYRALARIMEQVQGGDLIVNRGNESRPKDGGEPDKRNMNAVEGYEAAVKLSRANVEEMVKSNTKAQQDKAPKQSNITSPTTYSHIYLRIQPYFVTTATTVSPYPSSSSNSDPPTMTMRHLEFLLYLSDPEHNLLQVTTTQKVPEAWLGMWEKYDWVEDLVAEVLRVGVEVIGQEYVVARMGWSERDERKGENSMEEEKKGKEDEEREEEEDEEEE